MSNPKKTALDDVLKTKDGADSLQQQIASTEPRPPDSLDLLDKAIRYVENPSMIAVLPTEDAPDTQYLKVSVAREERYSNLPPVLVVSGDKVVPKPAFAQWFNTARRKSVRRITYAPGEPQFTEDNCLNTWQGWPFEPKEGDTNLWNKLLDFLFEGEPESRTWFEQWAAYPIQHPGKKLRQAACLFSKHRQVGKSLLGDLLKRVYGAAAKEIEGKDFCDGFNGSWAQNRSLIVVSEINQQDSRAIADSLKHWITASEIDINEKYVAKFQIPNRLNFLITSNHRDALFFSDYETRYFVHEVKGKPQTATFYKPFDRWLKTPPEQDRLTPALFYHLLHNVDCTKFNPNGHALRTKAFENMADANRSDVLTWAMELVKDPDTVIPDRPGLLFSTEDLLSFYRYQRDDFSVKKKGLSNALREAGLEMVNNGESVPTKNAKIKRQRLWPVRKREELQSLTADKLGELYSSPALLTKFASQNGIRRVK